MKKGISDAGSLDCFDQSCSAGEKASPNDAWQMFAGTIPPEW
jgi:hypothetical protein